ncbi:GNAT family N-acetyltransferase [Microvirga antarctica]|uniref:GNAT family N-acetyltransferase n=1 Tax=Microvirga antarctica TaxID=2819233 RepID=UPI001B317355|nr:GNAT family N-acetyltransferase [Microvirga antarctica]
MTEWSVSTTLDPAEIDMVYGWIAQDSYWAKGIPRATFDRSLAHSLCFALRDGEGVMAGFARVVTDRATFAYLADVFVSPSVRGRGAGKHLIAFVMAHPDVQGLRRWMLATRDAHSLYAQYGFTPLPFPERFMTRDDPDIYSRPAARE